jgi:hypothetical protein
MPCRVITVYWAAGKDLTKYTASVREVADMRS